MRSTENGFNENVYLYAAQERLTEANLSLKANPPQYVMACYLSGVAVECLLYAYSTRAKAADTWKHNLGTHALRGSFYNNMGDAERERVSKVLGTMSGRWQNSHRYRSKEGLQAFFVKEGLFVVKGPQTTKRDVVEYNAEILVNAATEIVNIGVRRWTI